MIGNVLSVLGRHREALKWLEEVVEKSRRVGGDDCRDTLAAKNNLALTLGDIDRKYEILLKSCI